MTTFSTHMNACSGRRVCSPAAAFTLVEIILAIGIATALLLVVLTFYNQAADMRSQVLREAQQVSTMRLVMDRLAADLRAVQPGSRGQFTGGSNSMSFVKVACTSLPANAPLGTKEPTDLVRVSLSTLFATNETGVVVSGLDRNEGPLAPPVTTNLLSLPDDPALFDLMLDMGDSSSLVLSNQTQIVTEPFADLVRFVRFRYWDGTAWQFEWTNSTPPPGVELVLSSSIAVSDLEDLDVDAFPPDALRRVVAIPAGVPLSPVDASSSTNSIAQSP